MPIPIISPPDLRIPATRADGPRLLSAPAPDYTIHTLDVGAELPGAELPGVGLAGAELPSSGQAPTYDDTPAGRARRAVEEMQRASELSEYHDTEWWQARLAAVRDALGE